MSVSESLRVLRSTSFFFSYESRGYSTSSSGLTVNVDLLIGMGNDVRSVESSGSSSVVQDFFFLDLCVSC